MQALVYENLFLILLIVGGVFIAIRATELFARPVPSNNAQWLNDEMNLRYLTGLRQYATGFVFYLVPVLMVYFLLSVSPELLSISMGIAGTSSSVGALSLAGSDVYTFAPVLAATAVVTLLNIRPFSAIEQYLRRMSHGIAGIPKHVQEIAHQIRQLDLLSMRSCSPVGRVQCREEQPVLGLDSDLAIIETLNEWIFGATGTRVWPDKANLALYSCTQSVASEYETIKRKHVVIRSASGKPDSATSTLLKDAMENFARDTRALRSRFTQLLAVLIANHDEHMSDLNTPEPLWRLISDAQAKRARLHHIETLATSTLTGIVICTPIAAIYYFIIIVSSGLSTNATLDVSSDALLVAGVSAMDFYWLSLLHATESAVWDVIGISLIFFTGCAIALHNRAGRENSSSWGLWNTREYPVTQYVVIALLATVAATLFYEIFLFFKLVVWPSLHYRSSVNFTSMLSDFGLHYVQFGLLSVLAVPCSVVVCRICDNKSTQRKHFNSLFRSQVWLLVLIVGVTSMMIYLLLSYHLSVDHELVPLLFSALVPSSTLTVMTAMFWRNHELTLADVPRLQYGRRAKSEADLTRAVNESRSEPGTVAAN